MILKVSEALQKCHKRTQEECDQDKHYFEDVNDGKYFLIEPNTLPFDESFFIHLITSLEFKINSLSENIVHDEILSDILSEPIDSDVSNESAEQLFGFFERCVSLSFFDLSFLINLTGLLKVSQGLSFGSDGLRLKQIVHWMIIVLIE